MGAQSDIHLECVYNNC